MVESNVSYRILNESTKVESNNLPHGEYGKLTSANLFESYDFEHSTKSLNQETDELLEYLYCFKPSEIGTPFQGTSFQITKDFAKVYFGSREGKIGIAKLDTKETIAEVDLKENQIWTLSLVNNDTYLFSGGAGGVIKKFLVQDLSQVGVFEGHKDEVNVIRMSKDQMTMYSTGDDGLLISWNISQIDPDPKVLLEFNDSFLGMDINQDDSLIAVVGRYGSLHVYSLKSNAIYKSLNWADFVSLWSVKFLSAKKQIAIGNSNGLIFLFSIETWQRLKVFSGHSGVVRVLDATKDEKFLVSCSYDTKILIWDLEHNRNPVKLIGHEKWVKALKIIDSEEIIVSMSDDRTIRAWKIPRFEFYSKAYLEGTDSRPLLNCFSCNSDPNVIYMQKLGNLTRLNLITGESQILTFNEYGSPVLAFNKSTNSFLLTYCQPIYTSRDVDLTEYEIVEYDGLSLSPIRTLRSSFHGIYFLGFTADNQTVLVGEFHRVTLVNYSDFTVIHTFLSHKSFVTNIITTNDQSLMFSVDQEGEVKSYNLVTNSEIKALTEAEPNRVTMILLSPNNDYLLLFDSNFNLSVWNTLKLIKVFSSQLFNVVDFFFSIDSLNLFVVEFSKIRSIQIPTFSTIYEIKCGNVKGACLSSDGCKLFVVQEDEVVIYENPEKCKKFACFGDIDQINDFLTYIGRLMGNKPLPYDPKYNTWIIEPHHMNMLHIYSSLGKLDYMQEALKDNIGFFLSRSGYSPLDICLVLNFEPGTELFYRKIKQKSRENPLFTAVLERSIKQLCIDRTEKTYKLLGLIFSESIDSSLKKYSHSNASLPIVQYTQNIFTDRNSFTSLIPYLNEGQPIEFLQTYCKINMVPGSIKSMELTQAILESENEKIFTTVFIQMILEEKWKKVRHVLWIQAIIYVLYLIFLSLYTITFNMVLLIISFSINILLILYELRQLASGCMYFKDIWNYLDMITAVLMTIMFIFSINESKPDSLTSVVLFFSWMRGISYFRIIKKTRYYINLILEVIKDILPFLSIVLYSTIAFGLIFQVLLSNEPTPYSTYFAVSWEMNVGGFNTDSYYGLTYIFFFLHSVLNPLLMLNLLISIMGFTFDNVNGNIQVADSRELASMILEGEQLFHWNRNIEESSYLHICQNIEGEKIEDETALGVRNVRKKIVEMSKSQSLMVENIQSISDRINAVQSTQDRIVEEVSQILKEIRSKGSV